MSNSVLDLCNDNALVIERKKKKEIWETISLHVVYFFPKLKINKKIQWHFQAEKLFAAHVLYMCVYYTDHVS